jgi:hypothetical protein
LVLDTEKPCYMSDLEAANNTTSRRELEGVQAVPWLGRLVAGLSLWRPGFALRSVRVGFILYTKWQ